MHVVSGALFGLGVRTYILQIVLLLLLLLLPYVLEELRIMDESFRTGCIKIEIILFVLHCCIFTFISILFDPGKRLNSNGGQLDRCLSMHYLYE